NVFSIAENQVIDGDYTRPASPEGLDEMRPDESTGPSNRYCGVFKSFHCWFSIEGKGCILIRRKSTLVEVTRKSLSQKNSHRHGLEAAHFHANRGTKVIVGRETSEEFKTILIVYIFLKDRFAGIVRCRNNDVALCNSIHHRSPI